MTYKLLNHSSLAVRVDLVKQNEDCNLGRSLNNLWQWRLWSCVCFWLHKFVVIQTCNLFTWSWIGMNYLLFGLSVFVFTRATTFGMLFLCVCFFFCMTVTHAICSFNDDCFIQWWVWRCYPFSADAHTLQLRAKAKDVRSVKLIHFLLLGVVYYC